MISLKIGFLLLSLTVIQVQQIWGSPCDRTCLGILNATVHADYNGCNEDVCHKNSIKCIKRVKGCHELTGKIVVNDSDWESYANKCTEIIKNFFLTVKKLLNVYEEECGDLNFNVSASIRRECSPKKLQKPGTTIRESTSKVHQPCWMKEKGNHVKAIKPKPCSSLRTSLNDFDSRKMTTTATPKSKDSKKSWQNCKKKKLSDRESPPIKDKREFGDKKVKNQKGNLLEDEKPDRKKSVESKIEEPTSKKPSTTGEEEKFSEGDSCGEVCKEKKESSNSKESQKTNKEVKKPDDAGSNGHSSSEDSQKFKNETITEDSQSNGHSEVVEEQNTNEDGKVDGTVLNAEKSDEESIEEIHRGPLYNDTVQEPEKAESHSEEKIKPKTESSSDVVKPVVTEPKDSLKEENVKQKASEESVDTEKDDCEEMTCKELKSDTPKSLKEEEETSSANKTEEDQNSGLEEPLQTDQWVSTVQPKASSVTEVQDTGDVDDEEKNKSDEDKEKVCEEGSGEDGCGQKEAKEKTSVDEEKDKHLDEQPSSTMQPMTTTTESLPSSDDEDSNEDYDYPDYNLPKTSKKGFEFIRITTAFPSIQN